MYSGITRGLFPVSKVVKKHNMIDYTVTLNADIVKKLKIGSSVNIDGVCQSVSNINELEISFTAIDETLRLTTLSDLFEGRLVSVEPSLCFGDEVGGHLMAGHISGTAEIAKIEQNHDNLSLTLQCPAEWMKYILPKGFIGVDGSSLTIGQTQDNPANPHGQFTLHLIPETLHVTNFDRKQIGDRVNIELDQQTVAIVNTVELKVSDITS